jgi:hypothetical protein
MPVFTASFAFIALLAVPLLIAIYWLRSRARQQRVSSLMLWLDERQRWEGGRRFEKLQTPLLFWLELLTILLLVLAAAGPMLRAGGSSRALVIVLDDSFSMLAGNEESARNRAARALTDELRNQRYEPVHVILAGAAPQFVGEATDAAQLNQLLQSWTCGSPAAQLDEAIALAFALGGNRARVLVVSDHAPAQGFSDSRLQWWAFGAVQPNIAFINAARTNNGAEERVLLEVANLSPSTASTTLTITALDAADSQSAIRNPQSIALGAGATQRITLTLAQAVPLRARLSDDALDVDNEVILLPEAHKPVRVELRISEASLRALIEKTLQALSQVVLTAERPALLITDEPVTNAASNDTWTLQLIADKDAVSLLGPFVVDRAHPLTEGLSLSGVVWGSGRAVQLPGAPIVTAGNIPLLTDVERAGRHELRLRLHPALSTLQTTPNWPVLMWNLINWRARSAPGLQLANVRLGGEVALITEADVAAITLTDPQRNTRQLPVLARSVLIKAERAGVYELGAPPNKYAFAANALARAESDLSHATAGRWGNWANAPELQWEYRSAAWVLLLIALLVLAIHTWLITRRSTRKRVAT